MHTQSHHQNTQTPTPTRYIDLLPLSHAESINLFTLLNMIGDQLPIKMITTYTCQFITVLCILSDLCHNVK